MAKLFYGDMWSVFNKVDYFIITTNSKIKRNNCLVMGRGIARQARDRLPRLDFVLGRDILRQCKQDEAVYGLLISSYAAPCFIGAFQVKRHYAQQADSRLIDKSSRMLFELATEKKDCLFALNYPGIGNGNLSIDAVKPYVEALPDNVMVWQFEKGK